MKTFEFEALDSSGKKKLGKVKAWSLAEAKKKIQQMGIYLVSLKALNSPGHPRAIIQRDSNGRAISFEKKSFAFLNELKQFFLTKVKMENS
jgi:type II secretory pathway component PulF